MDGSNPSRLNEDSPEHQTELTYDERQRRLSTAAKSASVSAGQPIPSLPMRMMGQYHRDSLGSPEANIDVSMVSHNRVSTRMKIRNYFLSSTRNEDLDR